MLSLPPLSWCTQPLKTTESVFQSLKTHEVFLSSADEPTNHLDLDTIEWLEKYLKQQDVPMVIVSHDRAFLDQLSTKIVETDMGGSEDVYRQLQ